MTLEPDYEHWTLRDPRDITRRVERLQVQLSVAAVRCTDTRVRKRAYTAELVLRAVANILDTEPDDEGAKQYTLNKLQNGLSQYGMRVELVPNANAVKGYVIRRDGRPSQ